MKKIKKIKQVEIQDDEDEFINEKESSDLIENLDDEYNDLGYYRDIKESMDRW